MQSYLIIYVTKVTIEDVKGKYRRLENLGLFFNVEKTLCVCVCFSH